MNLTNLAEPTTVIGLAGLAIFAVVYVTNSMSTKFTKTLEEKDRNYQNFVLERNHQTGEIIQRNTEILVTVGKSIEQNTDSIKQLVDVHLKR